MRRWTKAVIGCLMIGGILVAGGWSQKKSVTAVAKADGSYQISQTYPITDKDDNYDSSLLTNQTRRFYGYQGQGSLLVKTSSSEAFKVYVNGKEAATPLKKGSWYKIDIGSLTENGDNRLQVSQVRDQPKAKLEIKIPYPVLKDRSKNYQDDDNFKLIDQLIQAEINHGFTSAQLVVVKNGQIIKSSAYGRTNSYSQDGKRLKKGAKVTPDTLYDLASNTKMYATNYAIQHLVSHGKLDISKKVQDFFPDFTDKASDKVKGKDELTVKEILEHQAGFPADPQYHNRNYDPKADDLSTPDANKDLYTQKRDQVMKKIIATPLDYKPGTKTIYSDVDYMLLGFIVEKITGKKLDQYVKETYYRPLKLKHVTFKPLENGFKKNQIAATELNGNTRDGAVDFDHIRKGTIQGTVHDEKAFYSMEGVSGHAGLFANAKDLAVLTQISMNSGGYGNHQFFDSTTADQFTKPKDSDASFGLGWRRQGDQLYSWAFSPFANKNTVGHTGWTGTLTVIDPVNHTSVILLTNTKNSPVIDNKKDPNDFAGDHFLTGQYGLISTLAFDTDKKNNQPANDSKVVDMILSKYRAMKENEKDQAEADYDSLQALLDVAKKRRHSDVISDFMQTKEFKKIEKFSQKK